MNIDIEKLKDFLQTKPFHRTQTLRWKLEDPQFLASIAEERTPIAEIKVPVSRRVRARSEATSWDAAVSIGTEKGRQTFQRIYGILTQFGALTDSQISDMYKNMYNDPVSPSGLRSRRAELVVAGWVKATGNRRKNHRGRDEMVWEALPEM
jgi:hypothetical protein